MSTISASTTSNTAFKVTSDTTGTLVLQTGAVPTTAISIDASQAVGIGTASPATKLQLQTTGADVEVRATTITSGNVRYGFDLSGAFYNWIQSERSSGAMQFATANTEFMRLSATGNLGIGTSSPTTKLHVWQTGAATSLNIDGIENPIFASRYAANADGATLFLAKSRNATVGSHTILQNGDEIAVIKARGSNGTTFVDAASITFAVDGTPGSGSDMPGRIVFGTSPDGTSSVQERARITSGGDLGVGTSSPTTGSLSNVAILNAGIFSTSRGTVSAATSVATTIGTAPAIVNGTYIVSCGISASDPANYSAVSIVCVDNSVLRITALQTAGLLTLSVSGTNIRVTQASGITATVHFTFTRVS